MTGGVQINPETVPTLISALREQYDSLTTLLNGVETTNEDLKSAWEGQSAVSYANAVSEQMVYMRQLASVVESAATFLDGALRTYQQVDQNLTINS